MRALIVPERGDGLAVLVAFLGFAAALALGAWGAADRLAGGWAGALRDRATVELPADADPAKALATLEAQPGVETAQAMDRAEVEALMDPWLSPQDLRGLPLPTLIAVELKPHADAQAVALALPAPARLDTHTTWLGQALDGARRVRVLAAALFLATLAATAVAIAGATRGRLAVHRAEVDLLHSLGATRGQITGQFARRAALSSLLAGAAGAGAGAAALAAAGAATPWPLSLPPLLAAMGGALAYAMVRSYLRRMP